MVLKIGIKHSSPFVVIENGSYSGFAIDLWEKIAQNLNIKYEYIITKDSYKNIVSKVKKNEFDLVIGAFSYKSDDFNKVNFSIPWYYSNFAIVNKKHSIISNLFHHFKSVAYHLLLFFIVSLCINSLLFLKQKKRPWDMEIQHSIIGLSKFSFYNFISFFNYKSTSDILNTHGNITKLIARLYSFTGLLFFIYFVFQLYAFVKNSFIIPDTLPEKPILISSKNTSGLEYLQSRGAAVKVVDTKNSSSRALINLYLQNSKELAGVFTIEEGNISVDGKPYNDAPKYRDLQFQRYNLGRSKKVWIINKELVQTNAINAEILKLKQSGELYKIARKWLPEVHARSLH